MHYAFVTGMGRSGTRFLATLLASCRDVQAEHEYVGDREFWLLSWYLPADVYTRPYLAKAKSRIDQAGAAPLFVDVNGRLQNSVPVLHDVFNPVAVFHLVRDPREAVRSIYARRHEDNVHLAPKDRQDMARWLDGDKLFRVCWNWAATTRQLLMENCRLIRFEDLTGDYDACRGQLLAPLGLDLSKAAWRAAAARRVNATRPPLYRLAYARLRGKRYVADTLPAFGDWTKSQQQTLLDVCGPAMEACGYT